MLLSSTLMKTILPFHEEGGEAGAGATTEGVKDEETLKAGALIGQTTEAVQN